MSYKPSAQSKVIILIQPQTNNPELGKYYFRKCSISRALLSTEIITNS